MVNELNRISGMENLRDHLQELFELIGIQPKQITIGETPKLLALIELIIKDKALYSYLKDLDMQTVLATRKMKDIKLELWNCRENEKDLDQLEREKASLVEKVADLERQLEAEAQKPCVDGKDLEKMEEQLRVVLAEQMATAKALIAMRDEQILRGKWIRENNPQDQNAITLMEATIQRTERLLQQFGIEIVDATGQFDRDSQTVVGTVETEDAALVDQVKEVVRSGYRYQGQILRSQEVILYVESGD